MLFSNLPIFGSDLIDLMTKVALTNEGRWDDALQIFEKIVSSSERNALPWWLRYSMSLLEVGRGVEAVGYYQRTLKSFPREPEIKGTDRP